MLEAGAESVAGVGAGGEGPLRMRYCVAEVLSRNLIVFTLNRGEPEKLSKVAWACVM